MRIVRAAVASRCYRSIAHEAVGRASHLRTKEKVQNRSKLSTSSEHREMCEKLFILPALLAVIVLETSVYDIKRGGACLRLMHSSEKLNVRCSVSTFIVQKWILDGT